MVGENRVSKKGSSLLLNKFCIFVKQIMMKTTIANHLKSNMEIIDRKISPKIYDIQDFILTEPKNITLSNNVNAFVFSSENHEVVKIELIFKAGSKYHKNFRLPLLANKLLTEGTTNFSSEEIADKIEFYGASLQTNISNDFAFVSLTTLSKYLEQTLPILAEIVNNSAFHQKEIDLFLSKKTQELSINSQRVDFTVRNIFPSLIYGNEHPYGRPQIIEDFQKIVREDLIEFYNEFYRNNKFQIIISGSKINGLELLLENNFGKMANRNESIYQAMECRPAKEKKQAIMFPEAVQNAVRIGRPWVGRKHKDFAKLTFLNTLLGGYFGSRLMMNIREDKGFTYGIGSGISTMEDSSFMFISSEVKTENTKEAVKEIYKELQKLKNTKISEDELNLVKTVIQGSIQRGFDGPFATADRFKEITLSGLNMKYYTNFINEIKTTTAMDLMALSKKYFVFDAFYELIVGKY